MRRTLPVLLVTTLLLAACGSDGDSATDGTTADSTVTSDDTTANPDKPEVEIPDELPTELQVTVLEPGTGPEAQAGDTLIVDYVGVRSRDGVEFDNSYDPRQAGAVASPFTLVLGQGGVIAGWDQGLDGAQAGARLKIDIPSDLAYGESGSGDIIGENEALTFVVDVRAVVPPVDLTDEPTESGVDPSEGATEVTTVVVREGDGVALEPGQSALLRYVFFRGDNGALLQSSWSDELRPLPYTEDLFPPLYEGLEGMTVGERRAILFPPVYPDFGFGPEGNPTGGLPAETDAVIVVDLVAVYGTPD